MTQRRAADKATQTSPQAPGHQAGPSPRAGVSVRDALVAGGLRGFTPEQIFGHKAIVEGSIRGAYLQAACTCGWRGVKREKYGIAKNAQGRTVTAQVAGMEKAAEEIAAHLEVAP